MEKNVSRDLPEQGDERHIVWHRPYDKYAPLLPPFPKGLRPRNEALSTSEKALSET